MSIEQIRTDRYGGDVAWFPQQVQADQPRDGVTGELTFLELSDEHIQGCSGDNREAALLRTDVYRLALSYTSLSNPPAYRAAGKR